MKRKTMVFTALIAAMSLVVTAGACENKTGTQTDTEAPAAAAVNIEFPQFALAGNIADGVILHAWCWSFDTIRESMADIAAAGYSAVQTSPANAVIEGGNGGMQLMGRGKWYYQYQPTDWTVGNYQLGTEQDFIDMCAEADRYGVKIIVDVVPNHTAADKSAVSQALIDAAGGIEKLYHVSGDKNIVSYSSRIDCTSRSLSGLPDVNTENKGYQDYLIAYLDRLIADGADGFRFDAAKHIALPDDPQEDPDQPNNFWERITTEPTNASELFMYGEVLQGDNERIDAYIKAIGRTTASDYGKTISGLVPEGMLTASFMSDLQAGGSTDVVTWVESHDTYTGGKTVSLTDDRIIRCWAVIASGGYGTPLFFDRPYGSDMLNRWGDMNRIGAAGSMLYKDRTVAAVNRFRNAMAGESTVMKNPEGLPSVLVTERGSKGVVLVNGKDEQRDISVQVSLPDGVYPDRSGSNGDFTVSGGVLTGKLEGYKVAVLYNEGYTEPVAMPVVYAETDSFTVTDAGVKVTLHVTGAAEGTYTLDGKDTAYSDGEVITLKIDSGDTGTLTVSAVNGGFASRMTYWFTKEQTVSEGDTVTFTKPDDWGDTIYAYVYDETVNPVVKNAFWPGVEMTDEGGGVYSYILDRDWNNALIIFSDGSKQYPAAMEPGLLVMPYGNYYVGQ